MRTLAKNQKERHTYQMGRGSLFQRDLVKPKQFYEREKRTHVCVETQLAARLLTHTRAF